MVVEPSSDRFGVVEVVETVAVVVVILETFVAVLVVVVLPPCGSTDTVMSARA